MRALRAIWEFLRTVVGGTWRLIVGIYRRFVAVIAGLFGPLTAAFRRLLSAIKRQLDRLVEAILIAWSRIFQRAPRSPTDRWQTPGRSILPLLASTMAVAFWYLAPWRDWFTLDDRRFELAVYLTTLGAALLLRAALRSRPLNPLGRFLFHASQRTGLIWFERFSLIAAAAALFATWQIHTLRPVPILTTIAFLALVASPYDPRRLVDDLPPMPDLVTETEDATGATHRFTWQVLWGTHTDEFDLTVTVDTERYAQMQSINPGRPADPTEPDFTPWVVSGSTAEVDRAAAQIRDATNELGYTRFQEATAVLGFAQSIDYQSDADTAGTDEYWRYPIETIHEETGDCEDTTILAAAVLRRLGHHVLPLLAPGHAALGVAAPTDSEGSFVVHEGRRYYYCETTAEGFRIGEIPPGVAPDDLTPAPLREPKA